MTDGNTIASDGQLGNDERLADLRRKLAGHQALGTISYYFGHFAGRGDDPEEDYAEASRIWRHISLGLGEPIEWRRENLSSSEYSELRQAGADTLLASDPVRPIVEIWTRRLDEYGLRFTTDFDIPCPPPDEGTWDKLEAVAKLLKIDEEVAAHFAEMEKHYT